MVVVVQERAAAQVQMLAARTRRDDKGRVVGQAPLGPHLRPVIGAFAQRLLQCLRVACEARQPQAGGPLCPRALPRSVQRGPQALKPGGMRGRHRIDIQQHQFIGGGVVQPRHKVRAGRDGDAQGHQVLAHRRGVEQVGQRPGVDFTGLPTAGAAVQPRRMGVVGALAPVAGQQDQRGKVTHQAHGGQHAVGDGSALLGRAQGLGHLGAQFGGLCGGQARIFPARRRCTRRQALPGQLGTVQQPQRLHKAEARRRCGAELVPPCTPLQRTAPLARQHLGQVGVARAFGHTQRGRQQARKLRAGQRTAHRRIGDGQAEKSRKATGLHTRIHAFERPAKDFRAHVDAKQCLHFRGCGGGCHSLRQPRQQRLLVGDL